MSATRDEVPPMLSLEEAQHLPEEELRETLDRFVCGLVADFGEAMMAEKLRVVADIRHTKRMARDELIGLVRTYAYWFGQPPARGEAAAREILVPDEILVPREILVDLETLADLPLSPIRPMPGAKQRQ